MLEAGACDRKGAKDEGCLPKTANASQRRSDELRLWMRARYASSRLGCPSRSVVLALP